MITNFYIGYLAGKHFETTGSGFYSIHSWSGSYTNEFAEGWYEGVYEDNKYPLTY